MEKGVCKHHTNWFYIIASWINLNEFFTVFKFVKKVSQIRLVKIQ